MKKVNLFEELLQERNKQISTNELTSLLKNIWTKEDSKKERITQSLNDTNNGSFNQLKFEEMETKNIFHKCFFAKNISKKKVDNRSSKKNCKKTYTKYKVF